MSNFQLNHTEIKDQDLRDSSSNQIFAELPVTNEVWVKRIHFLIHATWNSLQERLCNNNCTFNIDASI